MIQKIKIPADIVLLVSRLIIGGIFMFSAYLKITDMAFTVASFGALHIPAFLSYIVAYGEMVFGICVVLGIIMSFSTLFLSVIMIFAVYFTYSLGFAMYAIPLAMLAGTLALHGAGAGKFKLPLPEKWR
jgi:uncharacterized membrane protein YphA (DoxX/SURF4 family)